MTRCNTVYYLLYTKKGKIYIHIYVCVCKKKVYTYIHILFFKETFMY